MRTLSEQDIREMLKRGIKDFTKSKIVGPALMDMNLSDCDFSGSEIFGATFYGSKLKNSKFVDCKIEWLDLSFTDLTGSDFSGSKMKWGSMCHVNIKDVNFSSVELERFSFYGTPIDTADGSPVLIHCFRHESELKLKDLKEMVDGMHAAGLPANAITNIQRVYNRGKEVADEKGDVEFGFNPKEGYFVKDGEEKYVSDTEYAGNTNLDKYKKKDKLGSYKK